MKFIPVAVALTVVAALLILLTKCDPTPPPKESGYIVLGDASGTAKAGKLLDIAKQHFMDKVTNMPAPSQATFMIFNSYVESSLCPPVVVTLNDSNNSTATSEARQKMRMRRLIS